MRKFVLFGLAIVAVAFAAAPTFAQTNQQTYGNGVDYFFGNPIVPPTDVTTAIRSFGSATSIGNSSGATEIVSHPIGVQQGGFQTWNGQAGAPTPPSASQPLGHTLMEFRRGGTALPQSSGTVVAVASWATSLPCNAPWFWIVTFTWGTTFTQTSSAGGCLAGGENFKFSLRGEANQTINNQNYFTGSGNERNLNAGGISFLEDTLVNTAFQLVGSQEWSHSYFQVDAMSQTNRDPSAGTSFTFGFDTGTVGTGGTQLRSNTSTINPGIPADAHAIRHQANQEIGLGSTAVISILAARNFGGGLAADATGTFTLPGGDGRTTNLCADPTLTGLGLSLTIVLKTGGNLSGITGDVGVTGSAQTIPLDLAQVDVPAGIQPVSINTQAVGIRSGSFSILTSADRYDVF